MAEDAHIESLKRLVEESAGHEMETSSDFEHLHVQMQHRIGEVVGVSTLKRIWGYIDGYDSVRESTLDIVSRFVGYPDWRTFLADFCGEKDRQSSHRIITSTLASADVAKGMLVALEWNPNRRLVVKHQGKGRYEVVEATNTKLDVGDTFQCARFLLGQSLYVDACKHAGLPPAPFVMGKQGGLTKVQLVAGQ
ncbi:MAG: hypothetical protein K6E93_08655 [Bacteroidales bacterium]|nr:hypothetical protein [Bacteroidales bacterium]